MSFSSSTQSDVWISGQALVDKLQQLDDWVCGSVSLYANSRFVWTSEDNSPKLTFEFDIRSIVYYDDSTRDGTNPVLQLNLISTHGYSGPAVVRFAFRSGGFVSFVLDLRKRLSSLTTQSIDSYHHQHHQNTKKPISAAYYHHHSAASVGISSIERNISENLANQSKLISTAFAGIKELLAMAGEMVDICRNITKKLVDTDGGAALDKDEITKFRTCMLSLGIVEDPVVKSSSGSKFHEHLSREICEVVLRALEASRRRVMPLAEVYCRVNRARGLELISPQDVIKACQEIESRSRIKFRTLTDGSSILELDSAETAKELRKPIMEFINSKKSISVYECAELCSVNVSMARESLLNLEQEGVVCRDLSIEGLRFYANLFLVVV